MARKGVYHIFSQNLDTYDEKSRRTCNEIYKPYLTISVYP